MAEIDLLNYNKRRLYDQIDQLNAFRYYLMMPLEVGKKFSNPFRKDPNPSASLRWMNGDLVMVDFGNAAYNGDIITLLQKTRSISYKQAFAMVYKDLYDKKQERLYKHRSQPQVKKPKERVKIEVVEQPFSYVDYTYWNQYGISLETLRKGRVMSCRQVIIGNETIVYQDHNPLYVYYIEEGVYKIYRPLGSKSEKFRFNGSADQAIQGLDLLPREGDLLIISKSWKDCLFLIQRGINTICTQGEGWEISEELINNLKTRFKTIILFYDRDRQGVRTAFNLWKKHRLDWRFIPKSNNAKDITDYYFKNNEKKTTELIWQLFGTVMQKME